MTSEKKSRPLPRFNKRLHAIVHARLFLRWVLLALIVGGLLGLVGAGFVHSVNAVTALRKAHLWIVLLLPAGGLLIVLLYHLCRSRNDRGTNQVLASIRSEAELPPQMAPLIFVSTVITHLFGGSAGREGAALQLGGSIANTMARLLHLRKRDKRVLILSGMSAAFSAIFGTPIAAVIFALEVGCVGSMQYAALVPCTVASLTASYLSGLLGATHEHYLVAGIPALDPLSVLKVLALGILCALVSILFCNTMQKTAALLRRFIKNPYLRILAAGAAVAICGLLLGTGDYFGTGSDVIVRAFTGDVDWYAFLLKILFTAVTLGGGYKGGEIVPTFFIGATLGCTAAPLLGLSPSLGAALGMAALFCAVTNCPLASLFIAAELFGMEAMPFFLLIIAVSYLLSGYWGLYKEQKFLQSKFTGAPVRHKTHK